MLSLISNSLMLSVSLGSLAAANTIMAPILHLQSDALGSFVPLIDMALGDPPQHIQAIFDTGSSDLIVGQADSAFCAMPQAGCQPDKGRGSFDPRNSNDTIPVGTVLNASFVNGETEQGSFQKTTGTVGGSTIQEFQFGLATNGSSLNPDAVLAPILGVGPVELEAGRTLYPNLPARMKELGLVGSSTFGVYLNDFRGSNGSVVFGGIDTAKFTGWLREAPVIPNARGVKAQFIVPFSSISLLPTLSCRSHLRRGIPTKINLTPQTGLPAALIDTGNPQILMPSNVLNKLADALGSRVKPDQDFIDPFDCGRVQGMSLRFGFHNDSAIVDVPLEILVVPAQIAKAAPGLCGVAIAESDKLNNGGFASIGAPFMQAVYTVFDVESERVLFAQAVVNATETNVQEVLAGWNGTFKGVAANNTPSPMV